MNENQLAGLCYLVAAVLGLIWWRLRLMDELDKEGDDNDDREE